MTTLMIRPLPILKIISNSCNTILLLFSSYVSFILHLYICLYCANWFTLCICRHSTKCRAEGGPGPATRSTRGRLRRRRQRWRRGAIRPAAPAAVQGGRCSRLPSPRPRRTGRRPLTTRTSSWPPRQEGVTLPLGGGGGFHFEHLIGTVLARVLAAPDAADPVSEEAGDSSQG